jgi:hypothetical protein
LNEGQRGLIDTLGRISESGHVELLDGHDNHN